MDILSSVCLQVAFPPVRATTAVILRGIGGNKEVSQTRYRTCHD